MQERLKQLVEVLYKQVAGKGIKGDKDKHELHTMLAEAMARSLRER